VVQHPVNTECISDADVANDKNYMAAESRGVCHAGDKCNSSGKCEAMPVAESAAKVCRASNGCCDAEEKCPGVADAALAFPCPEDAKLPTDFVCRATCADCPVDREEKCTGTDHCPLDVIVEDSMCIFAGKNTLVGTATFVVTATTTPDGSSDYRAAVSVNINSPYAIKVTQEPVKIAIGTAKPNANPGSYNVKTTTTGSVIQNYPIFTDDGTCTAALSPFYLAIHLDMSDGNTAWALPCSTGASNILQPAPFMQKLNNGREVQNGWGGYWTYTPCCKTDACTETCASHTGGGTTGGGGSGGGGGNGDATSYTCNLTCNNAANSQDSITCSNTQTIPTLQCGGRRNLRTSFF